jgi:hypothetical protein
MSGGVVSIRDTKGKPRSVLVCPYCLSFILRVQKPV